MTPERWQQIEEVLQAALDRSPPKRDSFLEEACAGDRDLRNEAASLISAYEEAADFIENPALTQDAYVLLGDSRESILGQKVGSYTIVERIGVGGMGEVYLAHDDRLDRPVALKVLPSYFADDDARLRRFKQEARAASALNHPNILTIHEVGEHDSIQFIATEFIDGPTVRELIDGQILPLGQILDIAEQLASALSAAHAAGIVHRDIKPDNIMRRPDGLVKILDFGIAKLMEQEVPRPSDETQTEARSQTEVGLVMGTVHYMSPEQARGLPVDERTDIWSFGVVLYEMLANRLPFTGATRMDSMVAILDRDPPPMWASANDAIPMAGALQRIVNKALRKERDDRFQTVEEFLEELKSVRNLPGVSLPLTIQTLSTLDSKQITRWRRGPTLLSFIALLLIILAVAGIIYRARVRQSQLDVASPPASPAVGKTYLQMNEGERLAFVREQEQRISTMMGDRPVRLNDEALFTIKLYVDRYVSMWGKSSEQGEETLEAVYGRARSHVPLIARSFAARKVPVIIGIYLPVLESAYRDCHESSLGAKGLFQFLPETAQQYGVAPNEMCDVEKMTPAAAHYIADRMAELGEDSQSLTLVLVSYNRGPEWVRNTLRELRDTEDYERNFWTLFAHRQKLDEGFRRETAGYVPAFFATAIIGENPQTFGLQIPPLSTIARQ
jgi:serine/threonine protein kinase